MARPLRLEFPGAHYHIISRGNARQPVFLEQWDASSFMELLAEVCQQQRWHCHAYCLMGNHYHLVIQTAQGNLADGMRRLNGVFTQRYNRRHQRVGHLFQGRYKSPLVQPGRQLLEVVRYVLLNPVRARLVRDPLDWPWSSCAWFLGERPAPDWASQASLREPFAEDGRELSAALRQFLAEGQRERVPGWSRDGVLGDDAFKARLADLIESRRQVRQHVVDERYIDRPSLSELISAQPGRQMKTQRDAQIVGAVERWHYSCSEVAEHLDMHPASISRIVAAARGMLKCET